MTNQSYSLNWQNRDHLCDGEKNLQLSWDLTRHLIAELIYLCSGKLRRPVRRRLISSTFSYDMDPR